MPLVSYMASPCAPSSVLYSGAPLATVSIYNAVVASGSSFTIPAGTRAFSVYLNAAAAKIDGVTRPAGYALNVDVASFGMTDLRFPAVTISDIGAGGEVHVVYIV